MNSPLIIVISGPGGVGKSTVVSKLIEAHPELWLSKSWTTRQQRPGESDDAYNFVTKEEFEAHIEADGFLEHTNFLGNYYGTPVPENLDGQDIILEIEVDGARQVKTSQPNALLIFLEAPSVEEQTKRLKARGDDPEKIEERLQKSAEEASAGRELGAHVVVNNEIKTTIDEMWQVICGGKDE